MQVGDGAKPHLQTFARKFERAADGLAFGSRQREVVVRRQHGKIGRRGTQQHLLLRSEQGVLRLTHDRLRLREALDDIHAKQGLRDRQGVGVGREVGDAGAEDRVLALDNALARRHRVHLEARRRQEPGARLVDGRTARLRIELCGAKLRVVFARELVDVAQGLRAQRGDDRHRRDARPR